MSVVAKRIYHLCPMRSRGVWVPARARSRSLVRDDSVESPIHFSNSHEGLIRTSLRATRSNPWLGIARSKMDLLRSARNDDAISHTPPRSRRVKTPELCRTDCPKERAQGMPGARCTRSLACESEKAHEVVTTGSPEQPGIPRAMVLRLTS